MEDEVAKLLRLARYLLQKGAPTSSQSAGRNVKIAYDSLMHSRYRVREGRASAEELEVVDKYLGGPETFLSADLRGEAVHRRLSDVCCASAGVRVRRHRVAVGENGPDWISEVLFVSFQSISPGSTTKKTPSLRRSNRNLNLTVSCICLPAHPE